MTSHGDSMIPLAVWRRHPDVDRPVPLSEPILPGGSYDARLSRARLWDVWSDGWAAAGLRPGQRPLPLKATRKTYAIRLMMAGVPTRTIQLLLGHAKLTSTEAYLPVDLNMMATGVALMTKHLDRM